MPSELYVWQKEADTHQMQEVSVEKQLCLLVVDCYCLDHVFYTLIGEKRKEGSDTVNVDVQVVNFSIKVTITVGPDRVLTHTTCEARRRARWPIKAGGLGMRSPTVPRILCF